MAHRGAFPGRRGSDTRIASRERPKALASGLLHAERLFAAAREKATERPCRLTSASGAALLVKQSVRSSSSVSQGAPWRGGLYLRCCSSAVLTSAGGRSR